MLKIPLVGFDYEVEGGVEIATKKKKTRRRAAERQAGDPTTKKKNVTSARAVSSPTGGGREKARRTGRGSVITRRTREPRRRSGLEPSLVGVCATRKIQREKKKKKKSNRDTHTQVIAFIVIGLPFSNLPAARRCEAQPPHHNHHHHLQAPAPGSMWAPPGPDAEQPQTGAASKTELERILSSHLQQQQQQQQHSSAPLSGANGSFADPLGPGLSLESLMQLQQHQAASASGGFPNDLASLAALHQPQLPPMSHKVKVACENCEVLLEVEVPANHPAPSMIVR